MLWILELVLFYSVNSYRVFLLIFDLFGSDISEEQVIDKGRDCCILEIDEEGRGREQ